MYEPQRLHPLSILDYLIKNIYSLLKGLLPLFLVALADAGIRKWFLLAVPFLLVLFVVYGVLYWLRYVFYLRGQELRLEYGVFVRKQRYIPIERIQSVQISAGILQRLLGVVKIQVETAGAGNQAEFVLSALPRQKAETLREILQAGRQIPDQAEQVPPAAEYRLSPRRLLLLATTSNGIGVVLSALLAAVSQLDDFFSDLNIWIKIGQYVENLAAGKISMFILVIVILFLFAWLISLAGSLIRFSGFRLTRDGDNIRISRGLLEKQQLTLPVKRLQAVKVVEGILRQPFGMLSVQVISISNSAGAKGEGNVLFPLLPHSRLHHYLQQMLPEFAVISDIKGLPASARRRYLLVNTLPALLIAILSAIFLPWGYLAFIIVPLAAWLGNAQYRSAGWLIDTDRLVLRTRTLGRVTTIVPRRKIQSMSVSQNFFQKRLGLASLRINTASGLGAAVVQVKGMDERTCQDIIQWFSARSAFYQ
ncbi:MAG TPA: PH domain-containing protein [Syntrophomonadaceae bacterium]|jgi:putative membrane protein|nr:PH domain-containing protein [Syntrophomonadaceae bacterium]HRX21804.1 PH domain-containing protein [Syntrophomonadaceae bacterium]